MTAPASGDKAAKTRGELLTGPVFPMVVKFGVPTMVSMLTPAIYNLTGAYFVSTLGTTAVAALGIVFSLHMILAAVGTVYILRTGDGMLSVSVGEQRARNWLERVLLFRPRTKEFLIAYPAIAAAYCCAAHRSRLTAWLFGVFGAIGFASVANTFCHIRAHFLVSLLRTGIGLALGLVLGMLILLILRACWPAPSDATQTKE